MKFLKKIALQLYKDYIYPKLLAAVQDNDYKFDDVLLAKIDELILIILK